MHCQKVPTPAFERNVEAQAAEASTGRSGIASSINAAAAEPELLRHRHHSYYRHRCRLMRQHAEQHALPPAEQQEAPESR